MFSDLFIINYFNIYSNSFTLNNSDFMDIIQLIKLFKLFNKQYITYKN